MKPDIAFATVAGVVAQPYENVEGLLPVEEQSRNRWAQHTNPTATYQRRKEAPAASCAAFARRRPFNTPSISCSFLVTSLKHCR
jgi:hypothetical protein